MIPFLLLCVLLTGQSNDFDPPKPYISPVFSSHMVLQREKATTFWGWTTPGAGVTVTIANRHEHALAESDGKWSVRLIPPKVGGPYTIDIDGPEHLELADVLVGDVWICSGQSNMEFGIKMEKDAEDEIARADDPLLRLYLAPQQVAYSPKETIEGQWVACSPETVVQRGWGGFSAVGYHFGRHLREQLGVPIGLIETAWGGTPAEAWTSEEALKPLGDFAKGLELVDSLRQEGSPPIGNYLDLWLRGTDLGSRPGAGWEREDIDESEWKAVDLPNVNGRSGFTNQTGVVWYRTDFQLPDPVPAGDARLSLGPLYWIDRTCVNGRYVGDSGWGPWPRLYVIPHGLLKPGKNVIASRVFSVESKRGFEGPADLLHVSFQNGLTIPLQHGWRARLGAVIDAEHPGPQSVEQFPNFPSVLYNGMVAPFTPLGIRGVIWYQGEANASRAWQYRRLLPAMIEDWRRSFNQGEFPFYIVSLAAFEPHKERPGDDEWAELRESQAITAATIANSGLALAIDCGDAADIHPKDKQTVAQRLARVALAKEYGMPVDYSGPVYRQIKREGSAIRVWFDHCERHLAFRDNVVGEFAIAGADRVWHVAQAKIDGETVVVWADDVAEPVAVRYAWQANPIATLINGNRLPAVPFRTDDWPAMTLGHR